MVRSFERHTPSLQAYSARAENMSDKRARVDSSISTGYRSLERRFCDICGRDFNVKGYATHRKKCEEEQRQRKDEEVYLDHLRKRGTHTVVV